MNVDVAIIGAGPAGSTLAALLARRGVRVALLDRDGFPRDKLCGEFLSYDALPILDALGVIKDIDAANAPHIERCRVIGARRTYEFALPHAARGVSRLFFDDLLLRAAEQAGAIRLDGTTASSLTASSVNDIGATIVVGAWGRWGRFDQQLGRGFVRDRSRRNFGFKRHYRGAAMNTIDLYSFARGYLGVNAVEGGITNICGLVHASRLAGHKGRWDAFVETIRAEEPRLDALYAAHEPAQDGYLSSEPVIFRARSAVEGGVFMIGDASGVIDPLTGNGIAMAIQSALLVAPMLLRLLESPLQRTAIEDEYRTRHHGFLARRIAWSRAVALLLSRPRLLDAALATARTPRIGELLLARTRGSRDEVERLAAAWFR
ncbi:MAG TPA: NAD(P)/FAD-dependent oxidoreductase [Thermoanaerobaculia bacterium]|jgi:flavin-dependent dehydrogenase